MSKNHWFHGRTKHIEVDFNFFVKELADDSSTFNLFPLLIRLPMDLQSPCLRPNLMCLSTISTWSSCD
jgi:hypothetical protein